MKPYTLILGSFLALGYISCQDENASPSPNPNPAPQELIFDFEDNLQGWQVDFADYPVGEKSFYELRFAQEALPAPLDPKQGGLMISGHNYSDDLFMYAKYKVDKLSPNTLYEVQIELEFASDVPDNTFGVGGSPGEGVTIKAGASTVEPQQSPDHSNHYRLNIDKDNQSNSGQDVWAIGDFSNDTDVYLFTLKTVKMDSALLVTSDDTGALWLIVGTDSGFESTTQIYYNQIKANIFPIEEE